MPKRTCPVFFAVAMALTCAAAVHAIELADADALYKAGKWADAAAAYEQVIPTLTGEEKGKALQNLGYALERDNKPQAAIARWTEALNYEGSTGQTRSYAMYRIGSVLYVPLQQHEKALETLLSVATIEDAHPNYIAEAYLVAGSVAKKLGDDERSLEILGRIEQVVEEQGAAPHNLSSAYLRMGPVLTELKRYPEAMEIYRKVLDYKGASSKQKAYASGYLAELELLAQGDLPFYIQPYVTNVSQTTAQLVWVTQGELPGHVQLREGADGTPVTVNAKADEIKATACFRQTADLTGLQAGALYHYTVHCADESREGSFRVNPLPGADVPVVIGVTGDTQAAPDIHLAVAKIIGEANPDFMIHVGDLTDRGSTWSKWREELFEPGYPYLHKCAFWPAVGNHDGGPYFPFLFHRGKKMWWSFDYGPVHVAILDSYWWGSSRRGGRAEQLAWLEESLVTSKATWKIVALHVPMVATRAELEWWGHEDFLPVMERAGVDMVLSGHHPMYRKYLPLSDPKHKPIYHVTTGGGGPTGPPTPSPILEVGSANAHATVIRIAGNNLELTATDTTGSVIDKFVMTKEGPGYQAEIMRKALDRDIAFKTRHIYHELLDEQNNQLVLDVDGAVMPGQPVQFVLDTTKLPRGALPLDQLPDDTKLLLAPEEGGEWLGAEASMPMDHSELRFTFVAPRRFTFGGGRFDPPLRVKMNLQVGERRLQPMVVTTRLSADSTQRIAAQTGGLPSVWDFRFDPENVGEKEMWFAADAPGEWQQLAVTAWWEKQLNTEYDGVAWYRTRAEAPKANPGERTWLLCGPIDESCTVYVNEKKVGEQVFDTNKDDSAWEKPRRFDITDAIKPGENLFAVRVQDLFGMGGMYGGAVITTEPANHLIGGDMDGALADWQVTLPDGTTRPVLTFTSGSLTFSRDNARYVDEHALRIDYKGDQPITLTRRFDLGVLAGPAACYARLQSRAVGHAHPHGADPVVIELWRDGRTDGEPAAKLTVPRDVPEGWTTYRGPIRLSGDELAITIRVTISQAGLYQFDEFGVIPAP